MLVKKDMMPVRMHLKTLIKQSPLYRAALPVLGLISDRQILSERRKYEHRARAMGLPLREEAASVFRRLREQLSKRGILWPPRPQGRSLHILYVSVPGNWERHNIPPELAKIGTVTTYFIADQPVHAYKRGESLRDSVDSHLPGFVEGLHRENPVDMMLSYLSGAQVSAETIRAIGNRGIATFNFHLDDRISFQGKRVGRLRAGAVDICAAFDLNLTSSPDSVVKYRVEGADAIFWPEGANPDHWRPLPLPYKYDVSFIGERYGRRPAFVAALRKQGIRVTCFGDGWDNGPVSAERMVEIYAQSRINLGFGYICRSSFMNLKGRDFEVPMSGAVYLTSHNEELELVYRVGTEIETYRDVHDCAEKIKELLADPDRCEGMRLAAREAALSRHTWATRVESLLDGSGFAGLAVTK
jgi:spore maturation protein CgeB